MQPLYTQAEFDAATGKQHLRLSCLFCGKQFARMKSCIQRAVSIQKAKSRKYCLDFCSIRCHNLYVYTKGSIRVVCAQCGRGVQKDPCETKGRANHFCSRSCNAKWQNAHKTKGTRVSKLELYLQKWLPMRFPGLEFHFNRKDAINGELDIFVPSLNLAFEMNGIFHYEPIYGPEKLGKIQSNDQRKFQACLERGIELCIVDASTFSYFKPARAVKFLDIVSAVIRRRVPTDGL